MKTIYKYPFAIADSVVLPMPAGAELLSVELQAGTPCLWAIVDTDREVVNRGLAVRGTGHPMTGEEGDFVGTLMLRNGSLVFHVFDRGEVNP